MLINKYNIKIEDSGKARHIYDAMDFYGQMDGYKKLDRETFNTSWRKGEKNHEWEAKTYIFTDAKGIKVRLHLNTPHEKQGETEKPIRNKETLEIIIFKKKGRPLRQQEIEDAVDKIEKITGIRDIKIFI